MTVASGDIIARQVAWFDTDEDGEATSLHARGRWNMAGIAVVDGTLRAWRPRGGRVRLDLSKLDALDTAGAWVLYRSIRQWRDAGLVADIAGARPDHAMLLRAVEVNDKPCEIEPPPGNAVLNVVRRVGTGTYDSYSELRDLLGFLGLIVAGLVGIIVRPRRLRLTALVHHIERVGLDALPIVGLLSFLIGVVLAYQGADQLQRFGAQIFVVNLIGISVTREMGILLAAIIVAGRSGSAFTAEIGSMKLREEIDAMRTLGLDPVERLVVPRVLALVIVMPLLAFYADLMGLLGGGVMAWVALDISPGLFIQRLNGAVGMWAFWVGIIKAPVFGFLIAMIGCNEGLRVGGNAESVGQRTTRSVVVSIFLVIVVDAIFSIFFAVIGI
jgi:phospholipid/cholesterol/gamma-HCH transport system permease protein